MWRLIKKTIQRHPRFLLTTHVNPDADGIGSATALIELLKMMGKEVRFLCDSPIPEKFRFLDFHGLHGTFDPNREYEDFPVMIILDAHREERIGRMKSLLKKSGREMIWIDHHEVSEKPAGYSAINAQASSTGSLIYTLFKECGYELNLNAAKGIYASIVCDTGRFCYSSTDRKAHKIAEECIKKGVDPDWMYSQLFRQISLPEFKLLTQSIKNMEFYFNNRVVIQQINLHEFEDFPVNDLDYIHDFTRPLRGLVCNLLLAELPKGEIRLSLRSHSDFPAGKIVEGLGGGGHHKAAGATIQGTLLEVKQKVLALIEQELFAMKLEPFPL